MREWITIITKAITIAIGTFGWITRERVNTIDDAIAILKGLRPKYEEHHKAEITDAAGADIVITGRCADSANRCTSSRSSAITARQACAGAAGN